MTTHRSAPRLPDTRGKGNPHDPDPAWQDAQERRIREHMRRVAAEEVAADPVAMEPGGQLLMWPTAA